MLNTPNSYSKYVVAFLAFAFTLIQGVDFVLQKLEIESDYLPYLLIALIAVFFVGLFVVWKKRKPESASSTGQPKRKWTLYLNIFVTLILGALFAYYFQKGRADNSMLHEMIPQIIEAYDNDDLGLVYAETKRLLDEGNENPVIQNYYEKVTVPVTIHTSPENVSVSFTQNRDSTQTAYSLGKTPLVNVRVPNTAFKLSFDTGQDSYSEFTHPYYLKSDTAWFILPSEPGVPEQHISFLGGQKALKFPGVDHLPSITIGPYSMCEFEVTNQEYKAFVDAGGYSNPEFWDFPYNMDGEALTFEGTIGQFVDGFGQPGPAQWSYGNFPEGQGRYPVTGISWFEARAYAKFRGLSLPNLYQWANAARLPRASQFVPNSNFSRNQLVEVGSLESQNPHGVYDIAGNAREWIINSVDSLDVKKGILGGGFKDDPYYFNDYYGQSVLDRSESNGMRLVKNLESSAELDPNSEKPVFIAVRDFLNEETVSDDVFEIFREQFDYPDKPLNATVSSTNISSGSFTADRFEISLPYEDGVLPGFIFYDSTYAKPLKPIIMFPGSNAIHLTDVEPMLKLMLNRTSHLMSEGYAVFLPMYLSTYERADELKSDYPNESESYKNHVVKWGKEYRRTIDYIVSRDDMDASNLTYYGISWGGYMANILLAIDDRVQSATLYVAGLCFQPSKKEVEAHLYTPRITMPVQMLNGKFDQFFPLETSQQPMYELLGTPVEHKRHFVSETGHFVPREELMKRHLEWLKMYEK